MIKEDVKSILALLKASDEKTYNNVIKTLSLIPTEQEEMLETNNLVEFKNGKYSFYIAKNPATKIDALDYMIMISNSKGVRSTFYFNETLYDEIKSEMELNNKNEYHSSFFDETKEYKNKETDIRYSLMNIDGKPTIYKSTASDNKKTKKEFFEIDLNRIEGNLNPQ